MHLYVSSVAMETDGEQSQQRASTNGSAASGTSSRPSAMNSMSLYERQAVQVTSAQMDSFEWDVSVFFYQTSPK